MNRLAAIVIVALGMAVLVAWFAYVGDGEGRRGGNHSPPDGSSAEAARAAQPTHVAEKNAPGVPAVPLREPVEPGTP